LVIFIIKRLRSSKAEDINIFIPQKKIDNDKNSWRLFEQDDIKAGLTKADCMRKNILILGHDYTTQFIDVFNQYMRLFDTQYFAVTVAYLTGEPNEEIRKRTLAEEVIFFNLPKKKIRSLKIGAIQTLLKLTREKQFQIVVCHRYKPSYLMMWAARFCKIPVVVSVMHELGTMNAVRRKLFLAAFARKNVLFAGVSNAVRDDMQKSLWFLPKDRIITLYNMIDIELTEPQLFNREEARQHLHLSHEDFVFGNLGRLVANKDQATLIRAFALIKPHAPKAKLLILGEGELEADLQSLIRELHLEDSIVLTGFLPQGFRYMKAFDCFVLSSIQEAFGRVLLEAMIARLPIIATRVNGIPEVMGRIGTLVNAKECEELAKAMQTIYTLTQKERDALGDEAYARAQHSFSIPCFRQQFWAVMPACVQFQTIPHHESPDVPE